MASLCSVKWGVQKRVSTHGYGCCYGASMNTRGPMIKPVDPYHARVCRTINQALSEVSAGTDFKWSSLQVNVDSISNVHRDSNNKGLSLIILLGGFEGGHLTVMDDDGGPDIRLEEKGVWFCFISPLGAPPARSPKHAAI